MYKTSLGSITAEIEALLVEKYSAKGRDLKQKIDHVGRRLPRKIRQHLSYLVEVETRYRNPKRAHQYEPGRVLEARKQCVSYLEKVNRKMMRSYRNTSILASVAVNMLLLAVLFFAAAYFLS